MPRLLLTRDQRTARALGIFLGFTTAMILYYWISRNMEINIKYCPTSYSKMTADEQNTALLFWYGRQIDNSPCEIHFELQLDCERYEFGHHNATYGDMKEYRGYVVCGSRVVLAVILVFVFRLIQLAVRLGFPCTDVDEDETEIPG
jgi:hypothetical protein